MPKGFLTEDGPRPEFTTLYAAQEMPTDRYRLRTEQNVRDSHGTLWFGRLDTPGAKTTLNACEGIGRPFLAIVPHRQIRPSDAAAWLRARTLLTVLNIAGNRESKAPGIGQSVERFLTELFRQLGQEGMSQPSGSD
jgi:hypothetical protein